VYVVSKTPHVQFCFPASAVDREGRSRITTINFSPKRANFKTLRLIS
jgi:hypothetical protein